MLITLLLGTALMAGGCGAPGERRAAGSTGTSASGAAEDVLTLSTAAERAYAEGRWIDAARLYQQLTRAVPEDAYAWFRLGNTYARQGEHERAVRAYEASVSRESAQPKAWFNLSTTYLLSAREALRRAGSGLRPEDPARAMIADRLRTLGTLLPDRFEEERGPGLPAAPLGAEPESGFEPVGVPAR